MGKILKPLLVVAAIAFNVIPGVGQVLSAAMISAITTAGITAGLGLAASALGLGPKSPSISPSSRERLYASIDPATPRKLVFGETALATDIRYQEWTGNDQEYLSEIVCVASHKVQSVDEIWFEDKLAWTAAGGAQGEYAGYLTVDVRTEGNAGNYVVIGNGAKWGANRRMTGLAYLHLRFKVTGNSKKKESPFGQSIPQRMTIIGKACPVYDARFDSTRGGAGPMRADDQTTWAYTYAGQDIGRNPANQLLTYLLGWRINGKLALGRGIPPERIDFDSFITAANACDEPVTLAAGGTEKRYRADGIFSEADDPRGVIDTFETTMNAKLRDAGGRFSLVVISNDLATPRFDFDDSDVLGEFRWTPTQDIERTFNEIRGRFTHPSRQALFQLVDYPRYRELPTDGIERVHVLDLPMVQSGSQAQRLAKQQFARNKYQGRFEAQMGARAWAVRLGDVVRLTFSALGWENRLFRVVEHGIRPDGVCPVVLQEEHADIYLWDADERPVVQPVALVPYDPSKSVLMQLLVAGEIDYANGATVESLRPAEPGADITGMHTSANTSAVGSRSAAAVNYDLDQAAATNTAQGLSITQILADVDNLEATYGSTANAATSAAAAAASASAAQGYATTANTAATNAANANTAAQTALTDANAARDTAIAQATSAAGSASSAAGSATTATNQANAAQGFATSASGSANVATTQAGNAAASASAASSSAASASGSASAAGLSASAAQTSSVEAGAKNSPSLNYNPYFDQAKTYWFADGPMTAAANGSVSATFQGRANVLNAAGYLYGYGHLVPITPGNKYELQSTFYVGNAAAKHYLGVVPYDASGNSLTPSSGFYFVFAYQGFAVGWHTVAAVNDFSSFPTATHAQIIYLFNYESAAGDYGVDSILLRDVTTREASAANASAAATSASTAAIQATNAAQSASAAQTSATNANTSAGNAATSASQASTSASNATGSASTASTQATNAANSAGVAAGRASAAAGSASTASTQATNAANSASAANASSVSAQSSATAAGLAQAATFPTRWHANNFDAYGTTGSPLPADSLSADGTRGEFTVGTSAYGYGVWERGIRPLAPGRKYRLHVTAAQTVNPGTTPYIFGIYVRGVLPNGTGDGTGDLVAGGSAPLAGVLANYTFDFTAPANPPGAIVGYRLGVLFNRDSGASPLPAGAKVIVTECYSRDITEQDAAAVSAAAAASSASSASTSASNAASSATSATNASNTAATQAGNASASASAASGSAASATTSASNAASSAASAASNATLVANFKNDVAAIDGNLEFNRGFEGWSAYATGAQPGVIYPASCYISGAWEGGNYFFAPAMVSAEVFTVKTWDIDPARKYKISANYGAYRTGASGDRAYFYIGFIGLDATGAAVDHGAFGSYRYCVTLGGNPGTVTDGQRFNASVIVTGSGNDSWLKFPPGTVKIRLLAFMNYNVGAATSRNVTTYLGGMNVEDITESSAAASSASVAQTAASSASASAAAAQTSAVLSASIGQGTLNRNPSFADWPGGSGTIPSDWYDWAGGISNTREAGDVGGFAFQQICAAGESRGLLSYPPGMVGKKAAGFYVLEADVTLVSGSLESAAAYISVGGVAFYIGFSLEKDSSNSVVGAGSAGKRYKFRKLIQYTGSGSDWVLYLLSNWEGYGTLPAKTIKWHSCSVRDATPAEIRDQTALAPLEATVSTHASAIATLSGRTLAFWQTEVVAGLANGATAFISARAETSPGNVSSTVAFGAREIHLFNSSTGGWRRAMTVANNEVIIYGSLTADAGIYLGTGVRWQVALRSKEFAVSDGVPVAYGVNIGNPALIVFKGDNLAPLGSGETYKLYAESSTGTGFTPRLRIITPGGTTSYNLTVDTAPGTGPTRQIDKASNPDASNNTYTFSLSFSYTGYGYYYGGGGGGGGGGGPIP
jgi:hypothetical protein